jgi:hypothetical protein
MLLAQRILRFILITAAVATTGTLPQPLTAQSDSGAMHHMPATTPDAPTDPSHAMMMMTPLGIPMDRMASGTAWIPDAAPIASSHTRIGRWDVMMHGAAFAQYITAGGPRGDEQFGALNWGMLMASRAVGGGMLQFRTMLSLDVLGVGGAGYPLLLQSGESFAGRALHDRQHPHDVWMELGALYQRPLSSEVALELYAAPSGEPALGPVAFMHRPSAMDNPLAPIGHHWQDVTHTSFGVATAGLFTRTWKLEGSLFNGREPDEDRWGFDFDKLDSYSGRLTITPSSRWSFSAGYGRLTMGDETARRLTAAMLYGSPLVAGRQWSASLIYGGNRHGGAPRWTHSLLAETSVAFDPKRTVFARAEWVQKDAAELVLAGTNVNADPERVFDLAQVSVGYIREIASGRGATLGLGVQAGLGVVPDALAPVYGSHYPRTAAIFLRLRPARSSSDLAHMPSADGHHIGDH